MERLKCGPIVEMPGDDMSRVIRDLMRDKLILPYVDIDLKVFDLSIANRNETDNMVTLQARDALKRYNCGVKCATITAERDVLEMYQLKHMWQSPNSIIRNSLRGALFREPIICANVPPLVKQWRKPIVVARHADFVVPGPGTLEVSFTPTIGSPYHVRVYEFQDTPGVAAAMCNTDKSITEFAYCCFQFAQRRNLPLYLSTKETILKKYDGRFKDIFERLYPKNVQAEVQGTRNIFPAPPNGRHGSKSDFVAQGFGSLGLMTSVLRCPDSKTMVADIAHGTVTEHYRRHKAGLETSTHSMATIYTWTEGVRHRGKLDGNPKLGIFANALEMAAIDLVETGCMTKDLALCVKGFGNVQRKDYLNTFEFIDKVAEQIGAKYKQVFLEQPA
ncbi:hypothetical protein V5799_022839 [Amblyomma americanum]|uniref:Isocitrate dehydrogenase [NADP] n=1 Tax=Amblyomma americanum TaxID=6943 RepID=A0AAQ4FJL6_AMBAM